MEIEWSKRAKKGLAKVVEYLEVNWSDEQIVQLKRDIDTLTNHIANHNYIGIQTGKRTNLRKAYPNKHTYLTYQINANKNILYIINFRANRQKPVKD